MNDLELLAKMYEESRERNVSFLGLVLENKDMLEGRDTLTDSYIVFGETNESENNLVILDMVGTADSPEDAFEHFKNGMLGEQRKLMTSREVRIVGISIMYRYLVEGEIGDE